MIRAWIVDASAEEIALGPSLVIRPRGVQPAGNAVDTGMAALTPEPGLIEEVRDAVVIPIPDQDGRKRSLCGEEMEVERQARAVAHQNTDVRAHPVAIGRDRSPAIRMLDELRHGSSPR